MGLDRARGDVQLRGDLHARVAERDQSQDLDLAGSQIVVGERSAQSLQPGGHAWADVLRAECSRANGLWQLPVGMLLQDEPDRTGGERLLPEDWAVVHRED